MITSSTLKKLGFFCFLLLTLINCKNKKQEIISKKDKSEITFKTWLKDTLNVLNNENNFVYKRNIILTKDSLSLDITKTFYRKIDPRNIDKIEPEELAYAIDLLKRSNNLPKDVFNLKLVISSYYSEPMVKQLKYESESEIKLFDVIKNNKIEKYKFLKGNFIEKKIINYQNSNIVDF